MNQHQQQLRTIIAQCIDHYKAEVAELGDLLSILVSSGIIPDATAFMPDHLHLRVPQLTSFADFLGDCGYRAESSYYSIDDERLPVIFLTASQRPLPYIHHVGFSVFLLPVAYNRLTLFNPFLRRQGIATGPIRKTEDGLLQISELTPSILLVERRVLPAYREPARYNDIEDAAKVRI
ncbi:MAG: hypothetical protein QM764_22265 [Chitinophagaceae bacterium]